MVNGLEALRWLRAAGTLPGLMILDLMMPVMNGWQFREAQLQDAHLAGIPVATLSATRAVDLTAVTHLEKPIHLDALLAFVASRLGAL